MSEVDVSRWDLPTVEGAPLPRPGQKGVNVMHLTIVEREAWEHGFKDGHVEGVRKGEAELAKRIAEVDVKLAALDAIMGALDAHNLMSTQALNSAAIQAGMKDILLNHAHLWETLRGRAVG